MEAARVARGGTARIEPAPEGICTGRRAVARSPANGAVAAGAAASTPGCAATRPRRRSAARLDADRALPVERARCGPRSPVIVRSECPTKTSIAPSSATAAASTSTRTTVRPGARRELADDERQASSCSARLRDDPAVQQLDRRGRRARRPRRRGWRSRRRSRAPGGAPRSGRARARRCPSRADRSARRRAAARGRWARARAIATRCASPPDSSPGRLSALWPSPTSSSSSSGLERRLVASDEAGGEGHVLVCREVRQQVRALEDVGDAMGTDARRARRVQRRERPAVPRHRCRGGGDQAAEHVQQRRLARAGSAAAAPPPRRSRRPDRHRRSASTRDSPTAVGRRATPRQRDQPVVHGRGHAARPSRSSTTRSTAVGRAIASE